MEQSGIGVPVGWLGHEPFPPDAETLCKEGLFRGLVMNEDHVGIATPANIQRLTGPDRYHVHVDSGFGGELREKIAEQARSLGRGRRGDGDRALLGEGRGANQQAGKRQERGASGVSRDFCSANRS